MPATNQRISAVLDEELAGWLQLRARAENRSVSTLVRDILTRFYAEEEERFWAAEGESRLATLAPSEAVGHDKAWE